MTGTTTIQGRTIGPDELAAVRALLQAHPQWSRYQLSRHLATRWDWRNPVGQLKDMAARTLLLKLAQRGWITLPARRCASPNRMRHQPAPRWTEPLDATPLRASLATLCPLILTEVSPPGGGPQRVLWEALLHRYHYLGYRSTVGENLAYLVSDRTGRPLACLLFGAAAWQCRARDEHIGWDAATRQRRPPTGPTSARPPGAPARTSPRSRRRRPRRCGSIRSAPTGGPACSRHDPPPGTPPAGADPARGAGRTLSAPRTAGGRTHRPPGADQP